jgi:hypothetical protein
MKPLEPVLEIIDIMNQLFSGANPGSLTVYKARRDIEASIEKLKDREDKSIKKRTVW